MTSAVPVSVRGLSGDESAEVRHLRKENEELKLASDIVRTASTFFPEFVPKPQSADLVFQLGHADTLRRSRALSGSGLLCPHWFTS